MHLVKILHFVPRLHKARYSTASKRMNRSTQGKWNRVQCIAQGFNQKNRRIEINAFSLRLKSPVLELLRNVAQNNPDQIACVRILRIVVM